MTPVSAAIALGSNLGDRQEHLRAAVEAMARLPGTRVIAVAPALENPALALPGVDTGGDYLNTAALVHTTLAPRTLLVELQRIEREQGRDRGGESRWAPRTLDLDIILYGDRVIQEPGLHVPHPRMHERRFVLEPLAAIAPELVVPGRGTVAELLAALNDHH